MGVARYGIARFHQPIDNHAIVGCFDGGITHAGHQDFHLGTGQFQLGLSFHKVLFRGGLGLPQAFQARYFSLGHGTGGPGFAQFCLKQFIVQRGEGIAFSDFVSLEPGKTGDTSFFLGMHAQYMAVHQCAGTFPGFRHRPLLHFGDFHQNGRGLVGLGCLGRRFAVTAGSEGREQQDEQESGVTGHDQYS